MSLSPLPKRVEADWQWENYQPFVQEMLDYDLTQDNLEAWLKQWTQLSYLIYDTRTELDVAATVNTADEVVEKKLHAFLENVIEPAMAADQQFKEKFLKSGLQAPEGFEVALKIMRTEADLFREENLPLFTEENKLGNEYNKIVGAQTFVWEGEEKPLPALALILQDADRSKREKGWRLARERQLQDRQAINDLWVKLLNNRQQQAKNAGFDNYRDFRWKQFSRFDYTPADCETFHNAIEEVVVPAMQRMNERRRKALGVDSLRPWDVNNPDVRGMADAYGRDPLKPFTDVAALESKTESIFRSVDPALGGYVKTMRDEKLLDLDSRKNKAPGGYCTSFNLRQRPFIFMNAVGVHDDVQTMLHEAGHAFHVFETAKLPYHQQNNYPTEFAEVASMSMELLAAPYLTADKGGFYDEKEAARARIDHLEGIIWFWPYMAVVDSFQHWVYSNIEAAKNPANCDAKWSELWDRFMKGEDWSGLQEIKETGWHRKLHIHLIPFYYVEYGLAQMGAVQVWRNSLTDQAKAIRDYRHALGLGYTVSLPELFQAAGAKFAFDANTLGSLVELAETKIHELETL